jgi:hypothetical protein
MGNVKSEPADDFGIGVPQMAPAVLRTVVSPDPDLKEEPNDKPTFPTQGVPCTEGNPANINQQTNFLRQLISSSNPEVLESASQVGLKSLAEVE